MARHSLPKALLLSLDQFAHTLLAPILFYRLTVDEDVTISAAIGALQLKHGSVPWKYPIAKIVGAGLDLIDKDHCVEAYRNELDELGDAE